MGEGTSQVSLSGIKIVVPCDLTSAREACVQIREFLSDRGLEDGELGEWELILAEAINNAVVYLPEDRKSTPVEVEVIVGSDEVTVKVHDHTEGMEWPESASLPSEESEGGRGIYLIQTMTDHADYRKGLHGNTLVMCRSTKNLRTPESSVTGDEGAESANDEVVAGLELTLDAMTEELSSCYESLSAIFHFSSELGQTQETKDFSKRLLDHVLEIVEAEWFVFRQYFSDRDLLILLSASDPHLMLPDLKVKEAEGTAGVELRAIQSRQDEWLSASEPVSAEEPLWTVAEGCHVIAHPIYLNDELLGVLSVGRPESASAFKAAQISFINTFAEFLGIQIVNVGYEKERINKGILTRELEIAQNIQRSLLPESLPDLGGFQLAASCESAREVGGDFYDVISLKDGCFVIVIADVMGKGIPAALFAAILRSLIRALPERSREPATLMATVNQILYGDLSGVDMFITAQVVFVDPKGGIAKVANAGHCPALFLHGDHKEVESVCPEGMPLGVLDDTVFTEATVELKGAGRILVYTDGVTEAADSSGEQFGDERLGEWFLTAESQGSGAEFFKNHLLERVRAFIGEEAPRDDMTFIVAAQKDA